MSYIDDIYLEAMQATNDFLSTGFTDMDDEEDLLEAAFDSFDEPEDEPIDEITQQDPSQPTDAFLKTGLINNIPEKDPVVEEDQPKYREGDELTNPTFIQKMSMNPLMRNFIKIGSPVLRTDQEQRLVEKTGAMAAGAGRQLDILGLYPESELEKFSKENYPDEYTSGKAVVGIPLVASIGFTNIIKYAGVMGGVIQPTIDYLTTKAFTEDDYEYSFGGGKSKAPYTSVATGESVGRDTTETEKKIINVMAFGGYLYASANAGKAVKAVKSSLQTAWHKFSKEIVQKRLPASLPVKYTAKEFNKLPIDSSDPSVLSQRKLAIQAGEANRGVNAQKYRGTPQKIDPRKALFDAKKNGVNFVETPERIIPQIVDKPWLKDIKYNLKPEVIKTHLKSQRGELFPDIPKPKTAVIKSQSGVAPPPLTKKLKESERFGLPKEAIAELQQAKKKIWESLRPAAIFDKIDSVYGKIAQVKEGATKIGNVVQETTILNAIEKGQEMVARDAFREGKKAGIYAQKDKFSDVVERAKSRKGLSNEVNKIRNQIKKIDVKNMRPEYKDQITSMIDSVDLVNRRGSTIKNLENMRAYIEENPDNIIPATKLAKLSILGKKKIKDLTIEDLRLFRDSVKHLEHLNKLKNKLIFGKKSRELAYVVGEARNNINKKKSMVEIDPSIMDTTVSEPKIGSLKQIFTVDSYNPELITEILDKEKNGIIKDVLYKGTDKGVTEQLRYAQGVHDVITESISGADISNWSEQFNTKATDVDYQTVALPSGKKIKLTKGERISFYLHSLNDKNLKHLLKGGWSYDKSSSIMNVMDDKDLKALITSMTPEEIKVANAMFDQLNTTQKQKLNEVSVELNGIEVATVDSYWPIRTNELDTISRAKKGKNNFTHATIEGMGMLQEKTNASNGIIIEDAFKTFYTSTKKASAYVGLAKPLRDARMLLQDNRFKQSIIQNYGKPYLTSMESYLDAIEDNSHNTENVDKLTTDLINKLDMAILGLNPFVMLKQPVSFVMASTEMDIKYLKKGLRTKTNFDEIKKFSPQLRDRLEGNVSRELGELGQVGEIKRYFTGKSPINNKLMAPIRFGDKVTIGKIWNSVKAEISEKYPKLEGDEYMKAVAERAEEVVRLTQLTSHVKDRSAIGRSKSTTVRLLTKYTSQRNKNYNAIKRSVEEYNRSPKSTKDKSKLFKKLFTITVISSAMIEGINASRDFIYKKDRKSWVERGVNTFGNTIGYAYGGGDAFSSIASKVKYGTFTGWDISNPASSFVNESFDAVAEIIRTIHQVVTQEASKGEAKWKKSSVRAIDKSLQTVLALKGVPYRTLKNLIKAPYKWVTESDNSDNVSEDTDMQDYLDSFSSDNDMQDYLDSYGDD